MRCASNRSASRQRSILPGVTLRIQRRAANLAKALATLDKAVDAAYKEDGGTASYANDGERVTFLFKRYAALTNLV